MDDATIHERIEQLVDEEHALWRRETDGDIDDATRRSPARAAGRPRPGVGPAPAAQGAEKGPPRSGGSTGCATRTSSRTTDSRHLAVILDNGVIRTLDPSLPTCGALAIAGPLIAGGVGTHEWALPTPERVDLARPLRHARVHRLPTCTSPPGRSRATTSTSRAPTRSRRLWRSLPTTPGAAAPGSAVPAGATRPGPSGRRPLRSTP